MSAGVRKLRLGPLPRTETVKLTVSVSTELKAMLDRYAELHAQTWGEPVDAVTLIPHMLAVFIERDRAFKAMQTKSKTSAASPHASATASPASVVVGEPAR